MSALVRRWQALWLEEIDARPLALFRILFGLYLLWYFGRFAGDVELAFSAAGVPTPYGPAWVPSPPIAWALYAALLAAAAAFTAGLAVRWSTPALLVLFVHHDLVYLASRYSAFDQLIAIFLALCSAAPTDARWALRAPRRERIPAWAPRLVLVQLYALYLGAALWKLQMPAWRSGEIVRRTLQCMWATDAGLWVARQPIPGAAYDLLAWSTIALELSLPVLLVMRRTRALGVTLGTLFHVTLAVLLHVEEFLLCTVCYVLLWAPARGCARAAGAYLSPGWPIRATEPRPAETSPTESARDASVGRTRPTCAPRRGWRSTRRRASSTSSSACTAPSARCR